MRRPRARPARRRAARVRRPRRPQRRRAAPRSRARPPPPRPPPTRPPPPQRPAPQRPRSVLPGRQRARPGGRSTAAIARDSSSAGHGAISIAVADATGVVGIRRRLGHVEPRVVALVDGQRRRRELGRQELVVRRLLVVRTERAREVDDRHRVVGQLPRLGDALRVVGDRAVPLVDRRIDRSGLDNGDRRGFGRFARLLDGQRTRPAPRPTPGWPSPQRSSAADSFVAAGADSTPTTSIGGRVASGCWASSGGSGCRGAPICRRRSSERARASSSSASSIAGSLRRSRGILAIPGLTSSSYPATGPT